MATPMAEKLNWRTLMSAAEDTPTETVAALDAYFAPFAQPEMEDSEDGKKKLTDQPCLKCGEPLCGGLLSLLGKGGFEWGLAHGEGHCRNCGWPARAYHFIKHAGGSELATIRNVILQYHPDHVSERKRKAAA